MKKRASKAADDAGIADEDQQIVRTIKSYRRESEGAKKRRLELTRANLDAYMGVQDWSHKIDGQSTEFLPKVPTAVEQFAAFIKRSLTQFGSWFSVDFGLNTTTALTQHHAIALLQAFFDDMPSGEADSHTIDVVLTDASKAGLLEAQMILKVHGCQVERRSFAVIDRENEETGQAEQALDTKSTYPWRLKVDLVRIEDYFPDPSGRGLYEIHRVEVDFHTVLEDAEYGKYDKAAVEAIKGQFEEEDRKRPERQRGASETSDSKYRRLITIDEFWGTLLDSSGEVIEKNCFAAIANDKWLIRKPRPNPQWHQQSPFIKIPLIRVPHSVWHKALYDHGTPLNIAINEMFNLMLDGGMAAVWGIKQLRSYALQDDTNVEGGIPQGATLLVNEQLPPGAKVLETVTEGNVPTDAMATFEMVIREFTAAVLTNETRLGALPPRQVKATEVVESNASQSVTLDAVVANIETGLEKMVRLCWLNIMQHADDLASDKVAAAIGTQAAAKLAMMTPPQRFAAFADSFQFKVHGLSATMSRTRDFQKTMALIQAVSASPLLMAAFMQRFSGGKILDTIIKQLNLNPEDLEKDVTEKANASQDMQQMQMVQQMMMGGGAAGGQQAQTTSTTGVGGPELPAEINQMGNNMATGMV